MKRVLRKLRNRFSRDQRGQVFILALILLILGSIVIAPLLSYMATGLRTTQVYDDKTEQLYAADSGVEDAKWKIHYDKISQSFTDYSPYDFDTVYSYEISDDAVNGEIGENVNLYPVTVDIQNTWIPADYIETPDKVTAKNIIEDYDDPSLGVFGSTSDNQIAIDYLGEPIQISQYKVKIIYTRGIEDPAALQVQRIGVWLPPGFQYFDDPGQTYDGAPIQSQLEGQDYPFSAVPVSEITKGNQMITWTFPTDAYGDYPALTSFPAAVLTQTENISTLEFIFYYRPLGQPTDTPDAVAWMTTAGFDDLPYSWNSDVKVYRILSTAGDVTTETYTSRSEMRANSSSVSGDYFATGNTLMYDADDDGHDIRDTWLNYDHSSDAVVSAADVGENNDPDSEDYNPTEIAAAYLYWTGWKSQEALSTIFEDTCGDFEEWDIASSNNQTRVPTADGDTAGNWNTAPCWDDVDETIPDISDYMTGTSTSSGSAYKLFTFNPFTVPSGMPINNLTIYCTVKDPVSNWGNPNNIRASIKVQGIRYDTIATTIDPSYNNWYNYSYSYATNPATGSAWTAEDINVALQQFGVYSTDLDPDIRVSMVYAKVNYGYDSRWTVDSSRFRGQGVSPLNEATQTLTMKNSLDLSFYAPGTVSIIWSQTTSGTLESADKVYYAFSNDGGITWSANTESVDPYSVTVPEEYLVSNFKMRFYFTYDATNEYVYLDNIRVVTELFTDDCADFNNFDQSSSGSRWSIVSGEFRGRGSSSATTAQRTLTLNHDLDLSPYEPGTVIVCWEQDVSGGLESNDVLSYQLSRDGGSTWSPSFESLRGSSVNSQFAAVIPENYVVGNTRFRIRFYFNFNSDSEYVYIDDIILGIMAPDTSVFFKIDGTQVYLSGSNPESGPGAITADYAEVIPSRADLAGYSYSCHADVTSLVRAFTKVDAGMDAEHSPGVATYTLGGVEATLGGFGSGGHHLAHAGWSLVLIYSSQKTAGHQLYLFDRFTYAAGNTDLDFDRDGQPGGKISGFIVPERIQEDGVWEQDVAKVTCFVGETDESWEGDFIALNAPEDYWDDTPHPEDIPNTYKLWDGINCDANSSSSPNNVWNGQSLGISANGIDIDTFTIPWDSGLLDVGDSTAHIDMYTEADNWNLVYIILSFRSKTTYGGALSYLIH